MAASSTGRRSPAASFDGAAEFAVASSTASFTVIVFGASGDLAKKKTYPAILELFAQGLLPPRLQVFGFARSKHSTESFREHLGAFLTGKAPKDTVDDFLSRCHYGSGASYDDEAGFSSLIRQAEALEGTGAESMEVNRVFYMAIPPTLFGQVGDLVKRLGFSATGWNRVIVEKPFGMDLATSAELSATLARSFSEEQVYRIDHYLGKEMVQNLMVLRFGNSVFEPIWNRHHIKMVTITFKEPFGIEGRAGYFDHYGIIRDVMQNHLTQVLSIVAMEPPVSLSAEDIRDEKVKVLRAIPPLQIDDVIVGQYTAQGDHKGYLEEEDVPADSVTPTFATAVLFVRNSRWRGVPFVLKCGKGLNERKAEIRLQFHETSTFLFAGSGSGGTYEPVRSREACVPDRGFDGSFRCAAPSGPSNELVIRIQPDESIYLKVMSKLPGLDNVAAASELALSYNSRYPLRKAPEAYARLILDVMRGDQSQFVRDDELDAAWAVFTPLLHRLAGTGEFASLGPVKPLPYRYGSRGPKESDLVLQKHGFTYDSEYSKSYRRSREGKSMLELRRAMALDHAQMRSIVNDFQHHMDLGLETDRPGASTLKQIYTHLDQSLDRTEVGRLWGLDIGGTNVRLVLYEFTPGSPPTRISVPGTEGTGGVFKKMIPPAMKKVHASELFEWLAACCVEAGVKSGDAIGFCFSFPYMQTALNRGFLLNWTKEFTNPGVETQYLSNEELADAEAVADREVAGLLERAIGAVGVADVSVAAICNDTVGTLLAGLMHHPTTVIGLILGTGTNIAYIENKRAIRKLSEAEASGSPIGVICMESGGFGSGPIPTSLLPLLRCDKAVLEETDRPMEQIFEKLISGKYMGAIARQALLGLHADGELFTGVSIPSSAPLLQLVGAARPADAPAIVGGAASDEDSHGPLSTRMLFECVRDSTEDSAPTRRVLFQLGVPHASDHDVHIVQEVCTLVARRAARLVGTALSAVLAKINAHHGINGDRSQPAVVAVDGSVFEHNTDFVTKAGPEGFKSWVLEAMTELGVHAELSAIPSASFEGAAAVAAIAMRLQRTGVKPQSCAKAAASFVRSRSNPVDRTPTVAPLAE
jgi:glucose-6-phosphate 1-dehydrogenase